jgi:homoisocitrate dehydrogenase
MSYRICVIEGDGIGHEVIPAALEVLESTGLSFELVPADAGWDCFQSYGTALPQQTLDAVKASDATIFGAITSPPYRVEGYVSAIRKLRLEFGLYANLRPTSSWPIETSRPDVDLLMVRENSEGLYVGQEESDGDTAIAKRVITRRGSERVVRLACRQALGRRRKLTLVHKANVLPETCGLFRSVGYAVASEFPELEVDDLFVDAMAMRLIRDPETFDVIVTTNMFGDILSDEASMLSGGLGMAPSGNIGEGAAIFEPVHGSAPDIAGQGLANPIAAILSAAMMLDYLQEPAAAGQIRRAIHVTFGKGLRTPDLGGTATTQEVVQAVVREMGG